MHFTKETTFDVSAEVLWAFHERPDAFELLIPPWQETQLIQPPTSLEVNSRVVLRTNFGSVWTTIVIEYVAYERGRMFADRMLEGPFPRWFHRHIITPEGPGASTLRDEVDFGFPLGVIGRIFGGGLARRQLERLFAYRHEVTGRECRAAAGLSSNASGGQRFGLGELLARIARKESADAKAAADARTPAKGPSVIDNLLTEFREASERGTQVLIVRLLRSDLKVLERDQRRLARR